MVFTISGLFIIDSNSVLDDTGGSFLCGSSIFHPEASRVAFLGSGGKRFGPIHLSVGGNTGSAIGPLLVAIIVAPYGQSNIIWFVLVGFLGIRFD
jgi:FSR family fosmidomycin resistance protein-like MFS transporter